jgi:DNA-binding protein HU-beta
VTRADLVVRMADAAGWPRATSDRALRTMLAAMRRALERGEPVTLVGFGTFSVARRRPRTIRNPRTGHPAAVASRTPRFKPSRELKRAVR